MLFDEFVGVHGFCQCVFIPGESIDVQVSYDCFSLHPPVPVSIHCSAVLMEFVKHSAARDVAFLGCICDLYDVRQNLVDILPDYACRLVEKPGPLDIVSERNDRIFAVPVIVEEKLQVAGTAVQDLLPENVQQIGNPLLQPFISAYPVEICIWLNDMEMRVHGLVLIRIFLA